MSRYTVGPEANSRYDFDPVAHVEAMHERNFVNGRLNADFRALASLRNARFQPDTVDDRMSMRRQIRQFSNGLFRYQDVIAISRSDQIHLDFPEEFLLEDLGSSPVEGLGAVHSIILNRVTSFEPSRQLGVDSIQVMCTAQSDLDESIRRDFLTFQLQDARGPSDMPLLNAQAGYAVWRGDQVIERCSRDLNDPVTLNDTHGILDVVSILTAELVLGAQTVDDLRA